MLDVVLSQFQYVYCLVRKRHVWFVHFPPLLDLEKELIDLLLMHKAAVALPGDALGKTTLLQHKIKPIRESLQRREQIVDSLS